MTLTDLTGVAPLLALAAGAVGTLLAIAVRRSHTAVFTVAVVSVLAALPLTGLAHTVAPRQITDLLVVDGYGLFFMGLFLAAALATLLFSPGYLRNWQGQVEEYYPLTLLATLGACVLALANHFASVFLGLELLSIPLYALIAYRRTAPNSIEAGLKYLILAGTGSALLLMGMALIYAATGSLRMADSLVVPSHTSMPAWALAGLALTLAGLGFKLALAPMHMWTADVYQGAPLPVAAFIATASKGAVLVLLLRYLTPVLVDAGTARSAVAFLAIASMFVGNLLALRQENLKRLLGYSSIAHLGYLLVAVLAAGTMATTAIALYLTAYFAATLTTFGVLIVLSSAPQETRDLAGLRGIAWRRPGLGVVLIVALLSLAGMPLTAGFFGKFYILLAGIHSALWVLVIVLVANSVVGLYYYLRIIATVVAEPAPAPSRDGGPVSLTDTLLLNALTIVTVCLGVFPAPLIALLGRIATGG